MKDHLKSFFPDRFEQSDISGLYASINKLLDYPRQAATRTKCERKVVDTFNGSDELKLIAGAMKKHGCNFEFSRHVSCERCNNCVGGFDPDTNQIIVCLDTYSKKNIMAAMAHEMIHMFDYCRAHFDYKNIEHVACSEIRAANLTFCSITDKLNLGGPGLFDFKGTHQCCVKDVAFKSVKAYSPQTEDKELWTVIEKVFPYCYYDLEPFGRRPWSKDESKRAYRERYHYGYVY